VGLSWRAEPIRSFVSLCNDFNKLNRELPLHGWVVTRTGGTPNDHYQLQPKSRLQSSGGG
jgi:hypothetical protein